VVVGISVIVESALNFFRSLRILRVFKVLRAIRLLSTLGARDFEVMNHRLFYSVKLLVGCGFMIAVLSYLVAVFYVQGLSQEILENGELSMDQVEKMKLYFGSTRIGTISLIMVITGGVEWREVYEAVRPAGEAYMLGILLYVMTFSIAVWNVVTSIFVDKALKLARLGDESHVEEHEKIAHEDARELRKLCHQIDVDSSGTINFLEFERLERTPEFKAFCRARGLDIKDTRLFFGMLKKSSDKDPSKGLTINFIVDSFLRLRGQGTNVDVQLLRFEMQEILINQERLLRSADTDGGHHRHRHHHRHHT